MAKKVVAALQKKSEESLVKVIKSVRSPKTGAYTFKEMMVTSDRIEEFLPKS